jgi:hypothetical protein
VSPHAQVVEDGVRDSARQRLVWTVDGGRGGEMSVAEDQPGSSTVRLELRGEDAVSQVDLKRSLAVLAQRVLARDDVEDAGRAWH